MRSVFLLVVISLAVCCWVGGVAVGNDLDAAVPPASVDTPVADAPATGQTSAATAALIASLTIFVLAVFVGFEVITKVPPTLHTPLMSGSNAISGITVVGALLAAAAVKEHKMAAILGMVAVAMATVNVVGGFLVTHRMLAMFKKKK
jgi:NAD(P) transhydrogenase subunit alpha